MKKITASVLALLFICSASLVQANSSTIDKPMVTAATTIAQVKKLLEEGC